MKLLVGIFRKYGRFCNVSRKNRVFSVESCLNNKHNLKTFQNEVLLVSRSFASDPTHTISEKSVKILLDHATKLYEKKENDKSEIAEILKIREVKVLVQERLEILENIQTLEGLMKNDKEMKQLAEEESKTYNESLKDLDNRLFEEILPKFGQELCDNIIIEVNAGVGGQEAMLFAKDLLEMYCNYSTYLGYTFTIVEIDSTSQGGIRHGSLSVSGRKAYEKLRHEGGVHRVQRVPATESSGRIHTSVASVVILPQPSEVEVSINDKDLKIETKRSQGAGGQHVNTTDSAVRIIHIPTGNAVECQTDRSQIRNKNLALVRLRTKIYMQRLNEQVTNTRDMRRKQMGVKSRNERIRTYNVLQDRVTDHRIKDGTIHNLKGFMEGGSKLEELQEKLQNDFRRKILVDTIEEIEKKK